MSRFMYSLGLLIGSLAYLGFEWGGAWLYAFPLVTFGLVPLLELLIAPDERNLELEEQRDRQADLLFRSLALLALPLQWLLLWRYLNLVSAGLEGWAWVGATLSMGVACGAYGINVAHELGHRLSKVERLASQGLLLTSLYMHFYIEHNRGHHAKVATPEDPASAAQGEVVYRFWWRSMFGGMRSAWALEAKRLSKRGLSVWSWRNQALVFYVLQLGFVLALASLWSPFVALSFCVSALIGALLLETVNYLEHYGLQRAQREGGGYEPVRPIHSWNSNHPLGRALLFELSRHSDHHAYPKRSYATLRHHPASLQLPTGYPGMILLSLFPPLFHRVMDAHLSRERARLGLDESLKEGLGEALGVSEAPYA